MVYDDIVDKLHLSKFKLFTPEQAKAIAHFVVFEAEREDAFQLEWVQHRLESMFKDGFSQEEFDIAWKKEEQFRIEHNKARRALERYWKQFI